MLLNLVHLTPEDFNQIRYPANRNMIRFRRRLMIGFIDTIYDWESFSIILIEVARHKSILTVFQLFISKF